VPSSWPLIRTLTSARIPLRHDADRVVAGGAADQEGDRSQQPGPIATARTETSGSRSRDAPLLSVTVIVTR